VAAYQSYPAITRVPNPTSKTVRREITVTEATAAVASRRQEQQQLMGSCRFSPLRSRTATNLSVPHFAGYIDRSLSPRLTSFPPVREGKA